MRRALLVTGSVLLALVPSLAAAQPSPAEASPAGASTGVAAPPIRYKTFLAELHKGNLELAAQRANIPIAEAQIAVAKVFPDPALTAGVGALDVTGKGSPTATTLGLGVTLELGGKRGARVAVATSDVGQVRAELDDFLRGLRANATESFIEGLYARLVLDRKRQTLRSLEKLVTVNEDRLRAGDVGKVALAQSRVEAQRFRGEVLSAEANVAAADLGLAVYLGAGGGGGPQRVAAAGDLKLKPRTFDVEGLIAEARANRPDLASKRRAVEGASARVDLAHANRWVDVTLNVGWAHSFAGARGTDFAQPPYDALSGTVTVPLPFSKAYRGELNAALATRVQSRTTVAAAELRIDVEVRQAAARYKASVDKLGLYTGGLMTDAEQVLDATLYNYQRGGATLLEVLVAQRTVNEVYLSYYDAMAEHARALVALEQAVGIWDLDF